MNDIIYQQDLKLGLGNEDLVYDKIKMKYGDSMVKTTRWNKIDYYNDDVIIELKTRRNKYSAYPTTMIGKNKIDHMLESGKVAVGCFSFTDGLYYIEIDKEKIEKFELKQGGRFDRGRPELSQYYYIPIDMLIKM